MPLAIGDRVRELGSQYHGTIVDLPNANQASVVWDGARGASTRAKSQSIGCCTCSIDVHTLQTAYS